jgi:hypothetical protein
MRPALLDDIDAVMAALGCPSPGDESVCPCGTPVVFGMDAGDWWSHADGSVSHDDGESVSDKMAAIAKAGGAAPKAGARNGTGQAGSATWTWSRTTRARSATR